MQPSATEPAPVTGASPLPAQPSTPAAGWVLLVCGSIGLAAALMLLVEKIRLVTDPAYVPSCSFSPLLSCGSVMSTPLSTVFVHWLIFLSLYPHRALCPNCMVVWVVTVTALVAVLTRWYRTGALPRWVGTYASTPVVAWILATTALIAVRFWDYWATRL